MFITECTGHTYGLKCNQSCGNCSGGVQCDHVTGRCPNGCDVGMYGDRCDFGTLIYILNFSSTSFYELAFRYISFQNKTWRKESLFDGF